MSKKKDSNDEFPMVIILEEFYKSRPERLYKDYCPTLRSERFGLKVVRIEKSENDI